MKTAFLKFFPATTWARIISAHLPTHISNNLCWLRRRQYLINHCDVLSYHCFKLLLGSEVPWFVLRRHAHLTHSKRVGQNGQIAWVKTFKAVRRIDAINFYIAITNYFSYHQPMFTTKVLKYFLLLLTLTFSISQTSSAHIYIIAPSSQFISDSIERVSGKIGNILVAPYRKTVQVDLTVSNLDSSQLNATYTVVFNDQDFDTGKALLSTMGSELSISLVLDRATIDSLPVRSFVIRMPSKL